MVVPDGWIICKTVDISKISIGLVTTMTSHYVSNGVPLIRNQNIKENRIDSSDLVYLDYEFAYRYKSRMLSAGDIVTIHTGDVGTSAVIQDKYDGCMGFATINSKPNPKIVDSLFLSYVYNSQSFKRKAVDAATGDGRQNLNLYDFVTFDVILPPIPEQRAIAAALSDMDDYITALEKLIAKKRAVKQGAMQELLTGKRRLPGFEGEWVEKALGELGVFSKGSGVSRADSNSGKLPCVRYGEIYTTHNDYIKAFKSFISREVAQTAKLLKKGDLLFTGSGETKEEIGKCVAFVYDYEAYAGGDIIILTPNCDVDPLFMGFMLNTPSVCKQKTSKGQGDAVVHITAKSLAGVTVSLPSLPEQRVIFSILSDMDAEIEALTAKLEKARRIKQGMMRELLTGRIRLI